MSRLKLIFHVLPKKMWPKVTAYALLGVVSALAAALFKGRIPESLSNTVGAETAGSILSILASSMLAVTTFSLSTMVSAYGAATSNVTPRATRLITEDKITQNALSTFLGTFLFSLVGIIALNMGIYEGGGRFILFIVTLVMVVFIVVRLIRWIERLTTLGRVNETNALIEKAAARAVIRRAHKPTFGCNRLDAPPPESAEGSAVEAKNGGYVQYVDAGGLSALAGRHDVDVYVFGMPGKYVSKGTPLAVLSGSLPPEAMKGFSACFTIADQRTFEQDPRFGLCVLAEVASRAMSPAINDHGTAIDIVSRLGRTLELYAAERKYEDAEFTRVWMPELCSDDLFMDAFHTVARDAAGSFEVQSRLQKVLAHLGGLAGDYRASALKYSRIALRYSNENLFLEEEKAELKKIAEKWSS